MIDSGLWIILLEAGVALGLLIFIVWWTLPRSGRKDVESRENLSDRKTK